MKLTKDHYQLMLYLEQCFWRSGAIPSYEAVRADGVECEEEFFKSALRSETFQNALVGRGVPEHALSERTKTGFSGKLLTELQMQVANTLLDVLDTRSRLKKLTELGVTTQTYNLWLRDPTYRAYCLDRAESLLIENQPVAHMSLINRVQQGDLGAVKYFNAMTGRYRERERAAVEVNINQNNNEKLIAIVEIIQKHVKDPATLEAIAGDILALNGAVAPVRQDYYQAISGTSAGAGAALSEPFVNGEIGKLSEVVNERSI